MINCIRCGECNFFSVGSECNCKMFELRIEDYHDEDFEEVWATNEEVAVRKLSEEKYDDEGGDPHEINDIVINKAGKKYEVTAEVTIEFHCMELE